MILFLECISFPRKLNNRFGVSPFFRRKVTIFIGRETKNTHFYLRKIDDTIFVEVSRQTIIILLEIMNC